jgi:hypothetical protein
MPDSCMFEKVPRAKGESHYNGGSKGLNVDLNVKARLISFILCLNYIYTHTDTHANSGCKYIPSLTNLVQKSKNFGCFLIIEVE